MQTFLPVPSFMGSALILDYKRLGKQRVEVLQLLRGQWSNHPCAKMWLGYHEALAEYGREICKAWIAKGYKDTCLGKINAIIAPERSYILPPWFGNEKFHASHRSNLLRKNKVFYSSYGWSEADNLEYIWPEV